MTNQVNELIPAYTPSPGEILKMELEARGWSQRQFSMILGKPAQAVNEIVRRENRSHQRLPCGLPLRSAPRLSCGSTWKPTTGSHLPGAPSRKTYWTKSSGAVRNCRTIRVFPSPTELTAQLLQRV